MHIAIERASFLVAPPADVPVKGKKASTVFGFGVFPLCVCRHLTHLVNVNASSMIEKYTHDTQAPGARRSHDYDHYTHLKEPVPGNSEISPSRLSGNFSISHGVSLGWLKLTLTLEA